jgi:hypothetical protein
MCKFIEAKSFGALATPNQETCLKILRDNPLKGRSQGL